MRTKNIENLVNLYGTLLNHTTELNILSKTLENTKNNIEQIVGLNECHKQTRQIAKTILEEDLDELLLNPMFNLLNKDIKSTSIIFINLVTFYNEKIIEYYNSVDDKNLQIIISELNDFNENAQKTFKPLSDKLLLLK